MPDKKIGEKYFRAAKMKVREAVRLQMRLARLLGPSFAEFADIIKMEAGSQIDEDVRDRRVMEVIGSFFASTDTEEAESILFNLCELAQVRVNDTNSYENVIPDMHLGDALNVYQLAMFVVGEQFGSFMAAVSRPTVGETATTERPSRMAISPQ